MKNLKITIALIIGATLLASCEKEIEFQGEQTDSKLVINCLAEVGKPIKAYISKSYFFLDDNGNTEAPEDLTALLYVNETLVGELTPQTDTLWKPSYSWSSQYPYTLVKVYAHPYQPSEGDVIKITASAQGFDDVEGTTSPLPASTSFQIKNIKLIDGEMWDYYNYDLEDTVWYMYGEAELTIEVTDPKPGQIDYFRIRVDGEQQYNEDYDPNYYYFSFWTEYTDPIFGGTSTTDVDFIDYQIEEPNGTFTDLLFDGRSYQIKLPMSFSISFVEDVEQGFYRPTLIMEHLTKEYYNYLRTNQQNSDIEQFFAEPIQTYSNVDKGYGLVGGMKVDTLWFSLPFN